MASSHLLFLSPPTTLHHHHHHHHQHLHQKPQITLKPHNHNSHQIQHFTTKCTSTPTDPTSQPQPPSTTPSTAEDLPLPYPSFETENNTSTFPIEKRRKSEIIRERRPKGLTKEEPPNYEIGWKRTKEIKLEKPKGYMIADFLTKLEELMGKNYGSNELLAKAGEIVAERAREEAEILRDDGEVEERMVTELFRVLRLMEMDLAMVKAAVKDDTLAKRIEQAKARCRQAILVALSF